MVDAVGRGVFKSTFMVSWKVSQLSRIGYSKLQFTGSNPVLTTKFKNYE